MKLRQARKVVHRYESVLRWLEGSASLLVATPRLVAKLARSRVTTVRRAYKRYGYTP